MITALLYRVTLFASDCSPGTTSTTVDQNGARIVNGGGQVSTTINNNTNSFDTCLPAVKANNSAIQMALQITFGVIGAICIIYLMYAAFRFVRSQGEPGEITQARQTIIYAIIGLVIAVSAEAIVTFALNKF